tara:strand:+ start:224 stop:883 length:660 start_codon:yes stop_codon:yes gene_type:complete
MEAIIKTACADNIKNSSFKNYKSISIKLFNIINKNDYNENMSEEEIMIGFGKVINKFYTLQSYLEEEKNNFKTTTKKNYINNLLNVILKIENIEKYCIKKKKKLEQIKIDIRNYWEALRKSLDTINTAKKNKDNEIEKNNECLSEEHNEEEEHNKEEELIIEAPVVELTSIGEIEKIIVELDLNNLEYKLAMLEKEKKCIEDKIVYIKNTIEYRKQQLS